MGDVNSPQYLLGLIGVRNWSQSCFDFNDLKMRELSQDGTGGKANTSERSAAASQMQKFTQPGRLGRNSKRQGERCPSQAREGRTESVPHRENMA
jgi:hypothetical protein